MKFLGNFRMKNLYLTITDECNLHCPHCYKEDFKKSLFSFEKIKKILEDNKDIDFIILYGGEFLLEKYSTKVIDLITFLKSKNLSISGTTNLCFKNLSEKSSYYTALFFYTFYGYYFFFIRMNRVSV